MTKTSLPNDSLHNPPENSSNGSSSNEPERTPEENTEKLPEQFNRPQGEHGLFRVLEGVWNVECRYMTDFEMPLCEAKGQAVIETLMDGLHMSISMWHRSKNDIRDIFPGADNIPKGRKFLCKVFVLYSYDCLSKRYKCIWFSNVNADICSLSGQWHEQSRRLVLRGSTVHHIHQSEIYIESSFRFPGFSPTMENPEMLDAFGWTVSSARPGTGKMEAVNRIAFERLPKSKSLLKNFFPDS